MVSQLKEEAGETNAKEDSLFDTLNSVEIPKIEETEVKIMDSVVVEEKNVSGDASKKKEEELQKLNITEIKALAKKKKIALLQSNKPKKRETLIQEILNA